MLVLRRAVDHDPHEGVGGRVAVSLARGAYQSGPGAHGGTLDLHGEHDVPGDAIALGDDEQARPMPAERRERRPQRRTIGDRGDAADAAIGVPGCHACVLAHRPRLDAGALRFGREALFIGGRAQVRDGDVGMADDFELPHDPRP